MVATENCVWKPRPPRRGLFPAHSRPRSQAAISGLSIYAKWQQSTCVCKQHCTSTIVCRPLPVSRFSEPITRERVNHDRITSMLGTPCILISIVRGQGKKDKQFFFRSSLGWPPLMMHDHSACDRILRVAHGSRSLCRNA
jgi:hypothetical protein